MYFLRAKTETHENHFAMVENFVEKYVPVRIQSQISETLHAIMPDQYVEPLDDFERGKFRDMHDAILDDDGIPDLVE